MAMESKVATSTANTVLPDVKKIIPATLSFKKNGRRSHEVKGVERGGIACPHNTMQL